MDRQKSVNLLQKFDEFWSIQDGNLPSQPWTRWTHFSRTWTKVNRWNYLWMTYFSGCSSLTTCLWTENNNLMIFWCGKGVNIPHSNPAKNTKCQPKMDRGKLSLKNCSFLTCSKSNCGQKTKIWPIFGAFKAFKVAITAFQPCTRWTHVRRNGPR